MPKPYDVKPVTRLIINGIPRELYDELQMLAWRSKSSASRLGLLAIEQLLITARSGALPLLSSHPVDETGKPHPRYLESISLSPEKIPDVMMGRTNPLNDEELTTGRAG